MPTNLPPEYFEKEAQLRAAKSNREKISLHKDFLTRFKSARVWGKGVFDGQMAGRDHQLHDGDVVELRT